MECHLYLGLKGNSGPDPGFAKRGVKSWNLGEAWFNCQKKGGGRWCPGGTDLEKGYGDVWPWRPPFHTSPAVRKGSISSKRVSSQDPLLRKFGNSSLYSLNFCPNFSSQAPNFGNFQFASPPFQRQISVRKPPTLEIWAAHPYLKKGWVPPRGVVGPDRHSYRGLGTHKWKWCACAYRKMEAGGIQCKILSKKGGHSVWAWKTLFFLFGVDSQNGGHSVCKCAISS